MLWYRIASRNVRVPLLCVGILSLLSQLAAATEDENIDPNGPVVGRRAAARIIQGSRQRRKIAENIASGNLEASAPVSRLASGVSSENSEPRSLQRVYFRWGSLELSDLGRVIDEGPTGRQRVRVRGKKSIGTFLVVHRNLLADADRIHVETLGGTVLGILPPNALAVRAPASVAKTVMRASPRVAAIFPWRGEWALGGRDLSEEKQQGRMRTRVYFFPGLEKEALGPGKLRGLSSSTLTLDNSASGADRVFVGNLSIREKLTLAHSGFVQWMEPADQQAVREIQTFAGEAPSVPRSWTARWPPFRSASDLLERALRISASWVGIGSSEPAPLVIDDKEGLVAGSKHSIPLHLSRKSDVQVSWVGRCQVPLAVADGTALAAPRVLVAHADRESELGVSSSGNCESSAILPQLVGDVKLEIITQLGYVGKLPYSLVLRPITR